MRADGTVAVNDRAAVVGADGSGIDGVWACGASVSVVDVVSGQAQAALARAVLEDAGYVANPGKNTFVHRRVASAADVGTSDYLTPPRHWRHAILGMGLGTQTFTHTSISYNDGSVGKNLLPYLRSVDASRLPIQDFYELPRTQMMAKFVAVAFYFGEIDRRAFRAKFDADVDADVDVDDAAEAAFVKARGLMHETGGQSGSWSALSLTPEGAKHFAGVIALFFAPSVQRYLVNRDPDHATDMDVARKKGAQAGRLKTGPVDVS